MASITDQLSKQVGPLPLGAWIVVVGGGLGIAYWSKRGSNDTVTVRDTSGDPGVGTGPGWTAVPPPTIGPATPTIETNDDWARQAINYLIAEGYEPALSDSAIRKYTQGMTLGIQEWALVRIALIKFGSLPTPLPGMDDSPPTNTPGPVQPAPIPDTDVPMGGSSWDISAIDDNGATVARTNGSGTPGTAKTRITAWALIQRANPNVARFVIHSAVGMGTSNPTMRVAAWLWNAANKPPYTSSGPALANVA